MRLFKTVVILILISTTYSEHTLDEQKDDNIEPLSNPEHDFTKELNKRTLGFKNSGVAKHVGINSLGHKVTFGYSPVDYKYVPVIKPLILKPVSHSHVWRPVLKPVRIKPVHYLPVKPVRRPVHNGGWKPVVPPNVPLPLKHPLKPWTDGWDNKKPSISLLPPIAGSGQHDVQIKPNPLDVDIRPVLPIVPAAPTVPINPPPQVPLQPINPVFPEHPLLPLPHVHSALYPQHIQPLVPLSPPLLHVGRPDMPVLPLGAAFNPELLHSKSVVQQHPIGFPALLPPQPIPQPALTPVHPALPSPLTPPNPISIVPPPAFIPAPPQPVAPIFPVTSPGIVHFPPSATGPAAPPPFLPEQPHPPIVPSPHPPIIPPHQNPSLPPIYFQHEPPTPPFINEHMPVQTHPVNPLFPTTHLHPLPSGAPPIHSTHPLYPDPQINPQAFPDHNPTDSHPIQPFNPSGNTPGSYPLPQSSGVEFHGKAAHLIPLGNPVHDAPNSQNINPGIQAPDDLFNYHAHQHAQLNQNIPQGHFISGVDQIPQSNLNPDINLHNVPQSVENHHISNHQQGLSIQPGNTDLQIPFHLPSHPSFQQQGVRVIP